MSRLVLTDLHELSTLNVFTSKSAPRSRPKWFMSLDVGQSNDPTALAVIESYTRRNVVDEYWALPEGVRAPSPEPPEKWYGKGSDGLVLKYPGAPARVNVRHLERLPLGMDYPSQADYIASLLKRHPLDVERPELLLDSTGVGRAVQQIYERAGLRPTGITITAGDKATRDHRYNTWNVPKLELVSRLQSALHERILHIDSKLPEARVLEAELGQFRVAFTDTGAVRFEHRTGEGHSDLVLALSIGVWFATREYYATMIGTYRI
jgi:hypothetical protein